jgi:hypothetical protein
VRKYAIFFVLNALIKDIAVEMAAATLRLMNQASATRSRPAIKVRFRSLRRVAGARKRIVMQLISEILRQVGFSQWYKSDEKLLQNVVDVCAD